MRRSIFHRHKPVHRHGVDCVKPKLTAIDSVPSGGVNPKKIDTTLLSNKPMRIGVLVTLLVGAVVWIGQDPAPPLLVEKTLSLNSDSSTEGEGKAAPVQPTLPAVVSAVPKLSSPIPAIQTYHASPVPSTTVVSSLEVSNQKAIELAKQGDSQGAVAQLEAALLSDPSVGLVFENLKRLYAGFATQSYQMALEPTKTSPVLVELYDAQQKHTITLATANTAAVMRKPLATQLANSEMLSLPSLPVLASASEVKVPLAATAVVPPKQESLPELAEKPHELMVAQPASKSVDLVAPAKPVELTAQERKGINTAIMQALKAWADAWSKKDVDGYLSAYSANYAPKGVSRKEWVEYRRLRIQTPKFIQVELSDQKVMLKGAKHARVSFTQSYVSDILRARNTKHIDMELIDGKWLITYESGR
jgi:hypothetical protein